MKISFKVLSLLLLLCTILSCFAGCPLNQGGNNDNQGGNNDNQGGNNDSGNSGNSGNSGSNTTKPATTEAATTPTTNAPTTEENPSEEKSGCGSSVAGGFALVMTVGAAGAMLVRRKKD